MASHQLLIISRTQRIHTKQFTSTSLLTFLQYLLSNKNFGGTGAGQSDLVILAFELSIDLVV